MNDETNMQPEAEGEGAIRSSKSEIRDDDGQRRAEACQPGGGTAEIEDVEPWAEAVDGGVLLDELEQVLRRFVVLPKWGAEALALWIVHTYAFELREVSTYIGIESPERRCGKTTLLGILEKLVNRPAATANISSPAFFRVIGEMRPTLMIDEADTFLKRNDSLRGILNAGYTRETAYVVRMSAVPREERRVQSPKSKVPLPLGNSGATGQSPEAQTPNLKSPPSLEGSYGGANGDGGAERRGAGERHHWKAARFSCWCPKVISMIGRLPGTLADRCIVIRMQRKLKNEECERMRKLEAKALRRKCLRFIKDHRQEIAVAEPAIPQSLNDRAADIWEPLVVIADIAGGKWPVAGREAAEGLSAGAEGSNPIASLLLDIALLFAGMTDQRIFSQTLANALSFSVDRPWMELVRNGKVTERWLAFVLRPYGVRPRNMRIDDRQGKGYCVDDFQQVFRRYVPQSEARALMEELRQEGEAEKEAAASKAAESDGAAAEDDPDGEMIEEEETGAEGV